EDRYRNLGHALIGGRLVFQAGSLLRRRHILAGEGVIGWTVRRSYFQRRAGRVTLTATTAAGRQHHSTVDIPTADALTMAGAATPGLLTPFLVPPPIPTVGQDARSGEREGSSPIPNS